MIFPPIALTILGCSLLSGVFYILSFPQINAFFLAPIIFIPVFFILQQLSRRQAFLIGWLSAFLAYVGILYWIGYVTVIGMLLLCAYLALYSGIFFLIAHAMRNSPWVLRWLMCPFIWVIGEWLRSHVMTGFGWGLLGHSQFAFKALIQIADITGVYGVSWLIMLLNMQLSEMVLNYFHKQRFTFSLRLTGVLTILILAGVLIYGMRALQNAQADAGHIKIGVIQPNIEQEKKWDPQYQTAIIHQHIKLNQEASKQDVDMIVWPETSLPGVLSDEIDLVRQIQQSAIDTQKPLVFGAVTQRGKAYFNSAIALNSDGDMLQQYDKIHLVPFGEFLPLRPWLGWINHFIALEDFTSGRDMTIFTTLGRGQAFGVLICFEDTISYVRRGLVRLGARFWVNMTNDAWFGISKAPWMHMQMAGFGSVEHKRALVRSANTGWSGVIDPWGRVLGQVENNKGQSIAIEGVTVIKTPLMTRTTFYTKYGDLFTFLGACVILVLCVGMMVGYNPIRNKIQS